MKQQKIFAISSSGGHFVQLTRLTKVFERYQTFFVSTDPSLEEAVSGKFYLVKDASMPSKIGLVILALQVFILLIKIRPNVIISTGAAPGFFALVFGKFLGAKTVWIDSIANVDELSLSGKKVGKWADLWLTQWPHLESDTGPKYIGSII